MFDKVIEFFSGIPNAHPYVYEGEHFNVILPKEGMTDVPTLNKNFRVGPYLLKCIYTTDHHVVGYIHASSL